MSRRAKENREKNSPTTGFRLPDDWRAELIARATARGLSEHELARLYVQEMLNSDIEREALRDAIKMLREEITRLREDMMFSVQALLHCAGRLTEEKAKAWVEKAFSSD